ncbi:MAG: glutathione S-transferase family protein [Woeseiaceae bacterium]|nr:glutathione S-transferase family protein [Woeseiaceae bacterium]
MATKLVIGNKNYSSWSLRTWFLLREAGIEFEEHRICLDVDDTQENIAQFSVSGRVPVLYIDDMAVWDTMAIAETVAERWPEKKLWPADVNARAHARSISAEMHSGFDALRAKMPMNCRAMGRKVALPADLTRDIDRIFSIWTDCYKQYGGDWLFGDFSIADSMYAPVVLRFRTYGVNLPESAYVYAKRVLESPAMQDWLAAAETEIEVIEHDEVGQ